MRQYLQQKAEAALQAIDEAISRQLALIMRHPSFQKLEGSWRGLQYLVTNKPASDQVKVRVLNASRREIYRDLERAVEYDQCEAFKKVYSHEFDMPGGQPYGLLVGDYEATNHPDDLDFLTTMSHITATAFCPFIAAASPNLLGLASWSSLSAAPDLKNAIGAIEYTKWRAYRDSEDSRFVALVLPRVLARLPYGAKTNPVKEFGFEELGPEGHDEGRPVPAGHFTWMSAAFVMAGRLLAAFERVGWCAAIRGQENGGEIRGLPAFRFPGDDGEIHASCPTEVALTGRAESELSGLGFLPLCRYRGADHAVFFGVQTTHKPRTYASHEATENAAIAARLPFVMAVSRFAHYLKVIARDLVGGLVEREELEARLGEWLSQYVGAGPDADEEERARFPLREARLEVVEGPGRSGVHVTAYLRPWLACEELSAALPIRFRIWP